MVLLSAAIALYLRSDRYPGGERSAVSVHVERQAGHGDLSRIRPKAFKLWTGLCRDPMGGSDASCAGTEAHSVKITREERTRGLRPLARACVAAHVGERHELVANFNGLLL